MINNTYVCRFVITLCALVPLVSYAQPITFINNTSHYSFTLPDGWVEIPRSVIDEKFQDSYNKVPNAPRYIAGYVYGPYEEAGPDTPYLLVAEKAFGKKATKQDWQDVSNYLVKADNPERQKAIDKVGSQLNRSIDINTDGSTVDQNNHSVTVKLTVKNDNVENISISQMYFGDERAVNIYVYGFLGQEEILSNVVAEISNTFHFEEGYAFSGQASNDLTDGVLTSGISGLLTIFAAMVFQRLFTRKKQKEVGNTKQS